MNSWALWESWDCLELHDRNRWIQLLSRCVLLFLVNWDGKDAGKSPRSWVVMVFRHKEPLCWYLLPPFPDLLTAADGRDRCLELWTGQVREGGVMWALSQWQQPCDTRLKVARFAEISFRINVCSKQYSIVLAGDFWIPPLITNCSTMWKLSLRENTLQKKHGKLTRKVSSLSF